MQRNLVIVHTSPFIQLGLRSMIAESTELFHYSVSGFTTLAQANERLSKIATGDVIILDMISWIVLNDSINSDVLQNIKANGAHFGLLVPEKQKAFNIGEVEGLSGTIRLEASMDEVVTAIKDIGQQHPKKLVFEKVISRSPAITAKQLCVLRLLAEGLSNKQIAMQLDIAACTVKGHLTKLLSRFGCRTRAQLIVAFMQACRPKFV